MIVKANIDSTKPVAVVTGGTGVLGGAMAAALAHAGVRVAIGSRTQERADSASAALSEKGKQAVGLQLDVTDRASVAAAVEQVVETWGRIDILVNAAGGNNPRATAFGDMSFFDLPKEALTDVMDLNILGTIIPSQVIGRIMAEQGEGSIVNISSMAADRPLTRVVGYSASKSAIENFTQWLAVHMAKNYSVNIRVNAIAPGVFETTQNKYLLRDEDGSLSDRGQKIIDHTPMGRFGDPEDLAGALLWLTSSAARFVTGITVPVDGGFSSYAGV